jgi:methionyl-tRNA formyltransferase
LRIAFLGTPEFAVPSLERLIESGFELAAVVTQPDKPKGRGGKTSAPPVKVTAERYGLPVHQPARIRTPEAAAFFRGLGVEAMAVVAYGKIIPQEIIDIPRLGLINVHASLLPKYRGAAPIQWAVAEGETQTGVTTMRISAGLDEGDILLVRETEIRPDETAVELAERLSVMGAELLVQTLNGLREGVIRPQPQDHERASFAPLLTKEAGRIDWRQPARTIHNRVRGFQPWPGAWTRFRGQLLHIWKSRPADAAPPGPPGALRAERHRLLAACGEGSLELLEVQREGRTRVSAAAFLNGLHPREGEILGGEPE